MPKLYFAKAMRWSREILMFLAAMYLVKLMFRLELDVYVYSSFDRSGTTEFKCRYLPASLLTVCSA